MKNITKRMVALLLMLTVMLSNVSADFVYAMEEVTNRLNYVYVERPYVKAPETQNIVVSWGDETETVSDMRITVEKEDGSTEEWPCTRQAEALYLFSREYTDVEEQSTYKVVDIRFNQNGEEQQFKLEDSDAEAEFGVNKEYDGIEELKPLDAEQAVVENGLETSIVTLGENGETEAQDNIAEALSEVTKASKTGARTNVSEKAGEIVVALDPGHDNKHGGASESGLIEQELTLKIANYAKAELETYAGVRVYMTRTSNDCPYPTTGKSAECIEQRVIAAAAAGAKIYVSMHLNSYPFSTAANGAEIIIPNSNWKPQHATEGKALAEKIMAELVAVGLNKRPTPIYSKDTTAGEKYEDGTKSDYFTVQICGKENNVPGIIIEHAFMTNSGDVNNFLNSEAGLKKLGVADATGIAKYFNLSKGTWEYQAGKGWKYKKGGQYVTSRWEYIGTAWYYFGADSYMCTEWLDLNGKRYYLGSDGSMRTDWQYINSKWYYFNESGAMQTGWLSDGGKWYYMDAQGVMQTGWLSLNGSKFYLNASGAALTGWQTIEGKKYYFDANAYMVTGWQTIDGKKYHFDEKTGELLEKHAPGWSYENGKWYYYNDYGNRVTGWLSDGGKWYYMDAQGVMQTGWLSLNGAKFYLGSNGAALIGWQTIGGKKYYFDANAYMLTGWQTIDGKKYHFDEKTGELIEKHAPGWSYENRKWYYYNAQGYRVTGWVIDGGKWYYMDAQGVMRTGWIIDGGKWYYLNGSGVMQTGWIIDGGKWYYLNGSGVMQTGWILVSGNWYYMDAQGVMLTDWQRIDGKWYYFNQSGVWIEQKPVAGTYLIEGTSAVTVNQMVQYFKNSKKEYPSEALSKGGAPDIETFCEIFMDEAMEEGIAVEVAFVQTMKETGWLQFGGRIQVEQFNFAGLGATDGGAQGADFSVYGEEGVRMGIRAQIQHLKAYASSTIKEQTLKNPCVDPRFKYVTKGSAKYVEWLGQKENPTGAGWATATKYGVSIVEMIQELKKIEG